jgi:hypothetical protein
VANLLAFHVVTMTKALRHLEADGHEVLAVLSPYQTEHINRFGTYVLNFKRTRGFPAPGLHKPPGEETSNSAAGQTASTPNGRA